MSFFKNWSGAFNTDTIILIAAIVGLGIAVLAKVAESISTTF